MTFFLLEPEVAGELGENTVIDTNQHPPLVKRLHYSLSGWLGDDILESFPCYIVTDRLADAISKTKLTGYAFAKVEVTQSSQFKQLYPHMNIPRFHWFQILGIPVRDDFGIETKHHLLVSARALAVLKTFTLANCDIREWHNYLSPPI